MNVCRWTSLSPDEVRQPDRLDEIRGFLQRQPERSPDHDPDWLRIKAGAYDASYRVFLCHDADGQLVGYAPFLVHKSRLEFAYAGRTLARIPVRRFAITARPLMADAHADAAPALQTLLARLRERPGPADVVFALGAPMESAFGRLIVSSARQGFLLLPHGPAYQRRRAKVAESLDAYLSGLGSKTRQDLRRQERRFVKQAENAVEVGICTDAASVEAFLAEVEQVSRLTYQWNLLGMGVRGGDAITAWLRGCADQGWLRGYVLKARGQPVAFMIGYLYAGTYYSESIGYDPAWHTFSVGNVLHLHVMQDLARLDPAVDWFDFMYGDNANKARLSTHSHAERNYYLIPDTVKWRVLVPALKTFDRATDTLTRVLDRYGVKEKIRKIMRQRAVRTPQTDSPDG